MAVWGEHQRAYISQILELIECAVFMDAFDSGGYRDAGYFSPGQAGPESCGRGDWIRTSDLPVSE
jgi:hypothetical protein